MLQSIIPLKSSRRTLGGCARDDSRDDRRQGADAARERIRLRPAWIEGPTGNPGRIDIELIEVQTGSYLGDDIERIEDDYHRT
jgi:hypothetical protein